LQALVKLEPEVQQSAVFRFRIQHGEKPILGFGKFSREFVMPHEESFRRERQGAGAEIRKKMVHTRNELRELSGVAAGECFQQQVQAFQVTGAAFGQTVLSSGYITRFLEERRKNK